jgi:hypothetical protein
VSSLGAAVEAEEEPCPWVTEEPQKPCPWVTEEPQKPCPWVTDSDKTDEDPSAVHTVLL